MQIDSIQAVKQPNNKFKFTVRFYAYEPMMVTARQLHSYSLFQRQVLEQLGEPFEHPVVQRARSALERTQFWHWVLREEFRKAERAALEEEEKVVEVTYGSE